MQEKQEFVVEQEGRLQALERFHTGLRRELETLQAELAALPMRERTQIAELERNVDIAEQELIELDARRELIVTSPQAGRVSGLTVKLGQVVGKELLSFDEIEEKITDPENLQKLRPDIEAHIDHFLRNKLKDVFPMLATLMGEKTILQLKDAFLLELESLFPVLMVMPW